MKKLIFPILSILFCCCQAAAQDTQFGALAGGNISWMNTRHLDKTESASDARAGMLLGGYFRFVISDKFALQPELMFAAYGARNLGAPNKIKLNYISLQVLGKANFTSEIFAVTGPQLGVLVSERDQHGDALNEFKWLYPSWLFGLGYSFNDIGLDVSLRYNLGLSDISKRKDEDGKMSALQLVVGYRLVGGD